MQGVAWLAWAELFRSPGHQPGHTSLSCWLFLSKQCSSHSIPVWGLGWKGPQSPISATPAVGRDTFHSSRMLQAPPAWPWTLLGVRHSLCVGSVSWDRQGWFVALGL